MKQETITIEKKRKLTPEQQEVVDSVKRSLKQAAEGKLKRFL